MREPYLADRYFYYWVAPGGRAPIVEWEAVLARDVDAPALARAVETALGIHANFRAHALVVDGRPMHEALAVGGSGVPVFADGAPRRMGTADTYGYLFYVAWSRRRVALRYFHSVADGCGGLAFLSCVLGCYLRELGCVDFELPAPDSSDTAPTFERILERMGKTLPHGKFDPRQCDVFSLPVMRYPGGTVQRLIEIDVPLAALLDLARRSGSSVVPTLQALIARALRGSFDVGEQVVVSYTSVDVRRVFGVETGGNAATHVLVPYGAQLDDLGLPTCAKALREVLSQQMLPENVAAEIAATMAGVAEGEASPYPIEAITAAIEASVLADSNASYTYSLSYPGKVSLPEGVEAFVDEVRTSVSAYTLPFAIEACEFKGIVRMMISQTFADDGVAKAIFAQIARALPGTAYVDRGERVCDELRLESLDHVAERG